MPRRNNRFAKQETLETVDTYLQIARGWVGEGKISWATAYYSVARARLEMFAERHPDYKRFANKKLSEIIEEQAQMDRRRK